MSGEKTRKMERPERAPIGREVWCTTCGRILDARHRNESERRWVCRGCAGDGMSDQTAAFLQVGPYVRPFDPARDYERVPMDGYVQTGPNSYERIATVDKDAAYAEARRAEIEYFKRSAK